MARKNNDKGSYGERIAKIEVNIDNMVATINDIKTNHLASIDKKLNEINEMFQSRLPIWASIVITFLTSGCVGLLVLYLSTIGKI